MTKEVLKGLNEHNLCTYFVLPLLKLNKFRFIADSNFMDSYLSTDNKFIYVKVLEVLFIRHQLDAHPNFVEVIKQYNGYTFIKYSIPLEFKPDVELFTKGQYSKLSRKAKELIIKYSGLIWETRNREGIMSSDIRLLALERSEILRRLWEDYLKVSISNDNELLSIPTEKTYIDPVTLQGKFITEEVSY